MRKYLYRFTEYNEQGHLDLFARYILIVVGIAIGTTLNYIISQTPARTDAIVRTVVLAIALSILTPSVFLLVERQIFARFWPRTAHYLPSIVTFGVWLLMAAWVGAYRNYSSDNVGLAQVIIAGISVHSSRETLCLFNFPLLFYIVSNVLLVHYFPPNAPPPIDQPVRRSDILDDL